MCEGRILPWLKPGPTSLWSLEQGLTSEWVVGFYTAYQECSDFLERHGKGLGSHPDARPTTTADRSRQSKRTWYQLSSIAYYLAILRRSF